MISLTDYNYIYEELSASNKKKLDDMIDNGIINDENIGTIDKLLADNEKLSKLNSPEYIKKAQKFFEKHGLAKYKWGRNKTAISEFNTIFKNKVDILERIIDGDGIISFKNLPTSGNIFSICKGFQDEAKSISTIKISGSASVGPCEILLKFILNEGTSANEGDVYLSGIGPLEVKAVTKTKTFSGGHAAGQKSKDADGNSTSIRGSWSVYNYVYSKLFNIDWDEANEIANEKSNAFLMNKDSYAAFNTNYIEKFKPSVDDFANALTEAFMFQYEYLTQDGKENSRTKLVSPKLKSLVKSELSKIYKNGKLDSDNQKLLDIVGAVQLYLYSLTEEFKYFMAIFYDYNDLDTNELDYDEDPSLVNGSGYYIVKKAEELENISETIKHLKFGTLDDLRSGQGKTGKIFFKNVTPYKKSKTSKK